MKQKLFFTNEYIEQTLQSIIVKNNIMFPNDLILSYLIIK